MLVFVPAAAWVGNGSAAAAPIPGAPGTHPTPRLGPPLKTIHLLFLGMENV